MSSEARTGKVTAARSARHGVPPAPPRRSEALVAPKKGGLARLVPFNAGVRWFAAACAFAAALAPSLAWADAEACVAARSDGQVARDEGRLLLAVTLFRQCAVTGCPGPIQRECSASLSDTESSLPSVVLSARDPEGSDVLDVTVTLDGEPIAEPLSGLALPVDPGQRHFEFARSDGTRVSVDMVAQVGVQRRPVTAVFEPKREQPLSVAAEPKPVEAQAESSGFVGAPLAIVLASVGTVALGGFTYFALDGRSQQRELERTCAPDCAPSAVNEIENQYLLADVALVTAVAAYSGAAYVYLTAAPSPSPETGSVDWNIVARGRF